MVSKCRILSIHSMDMGSPLVAVGTLESKRHDLRRSNFEPPLPPATSVRWVKKLRERSTCNQSEDANHRRGYDRDEEKPVMQRRLGHHIDTLNTSGKSTTNQRNLQGFPCSLFAMFRA